MNKDIEDLKAIGWFFLFMGLSMKAQAARLNENNLGTDRLENISDCNIAVTEDTSEVGSFVIKE